ncbi:hypothetical protein EOL70_13440 [Leucothrix sargassi]|nr:hypothetical protein EOL70_13440 [Leucothrix sargassi]
MSTLPPSFLTTDIQPRDEAVADVVVNNIAFFPTIKLVDFMERYQVDDNYSVNRRVQCLSEAIRQINGELKEQRAKWLHDEYLSLDDVPQDTLTAVDTEISDKVLVQAYFDAVCCFALKILNERFAATDTTQAASQKISKSEGVIDHWTGDYIRHVHFLLGDEGATMEIKAI